MKNVNRRIMAAILVATVMTVMGWSGVTSARMQFGNLEVSGEIFSIAEIRLSGRDSGPREFSLAVAPGLFLGPGDFPATKGTPNRDRYDTLTMWRTELLLEFSYHGIGHVTPVLKLRPYWDAMFAINDKNDSVSDFWETNMRSGLNDEWDPLIREAYLDFSYDSLFVRAGRQIVTWGRSDGVTVLDVVTPRNFRNPLTFEQERFMIPQWMINTKLDLTSYEWIPGGISKELQVVWNIDYMPSRFPGFSQQEEGQHPWTLAVVDFADQIINVSEGLFGESNFFDHDKWDEGDVWDKSEVFVRWQARTGLDAGWFSDMTYSFHYAYLYEDLPLYELQNRIDAGFAFNIAGPRTGFGGGIDFDRNRYQLAGASFDKALMWLPGQFQGTVMRGELVYNFGQKFYEPDLNTVETNSITFLTGFDQYLYIGPRSWFETPWFTSFQYWRDEILRDPGVGQFTNIGSVACNAQPGCGNKGYIIGGESNAFNGLRNRTRNVFTLFMFNDFLPGKTLHVELFGLHELGGRQQSTWVRGVVGYAFDSHITGRVGINVVNGKGDAFFGEFKHNDSMFFELKYTF